MNFVDNEKITESFLLNENPFTFSDEEFGSKEMKLKLEAIQSIQPPFIPYAIDQAALKTSLREYYQNHEKAIKAFLDEYFEKKNMKDVDYQEFLKDRDNEEVLQLLIKIKQIKLYSKQSQLRDRVYLGLKEIMSTEQFESAHLCKIPNEAKDAALVSALEQKNNSELSDMN